MTRPGAKSFSRIPPLCYTVPMPVHNADIAALFTEIADLQEILGENPFRIRAYRNAARVLADHGREIRELVAAGEDLTAIDGIGDDLAKKIRQIVETGTVDKVEELRKKLPPGITDLLRVQGLGPKRVKMLLDELQIANREQLAAACREGRVRGLKGFGEKLEAAMLQTLESQLAQGVRFRRATVQPSVESLLAHLRKVTGVLRAEVAGSYRRGRETVGDLDLLCCATPASPVMARFVAYDEVAKVLGQGETKSSVVLRSGLQVDLRVVPADSWGAALHYFTGSQAHNIALRRRAQDRGLKLNEYALSRDEVPVAGKTEESIFQTLELRFIPPELREDRGEVAAAEQGTLPRLIDVGDIRGDLHNHTVWSDGSLTIEELARAAKARGYEYIAVTDHSKRLTVANGLDEERLRRQIDEIDKVQGIVKGIRILKGSEVDILEDGSLDIDDATLALLDVVVVSVHHKFNLSLEKQTERVLRALDHPATTILAHPTGRLLPDRPPYEIDMAAVIARAKARGVAIELNANPYRLDLDDRQCRMAKEAGVLVSIDSDAHGPNDLENIRHGVVQARRGWLEAADVLNTRPLAALPLKSRKR